MSSTQDPMQGVSHGSEEGYLTVDLQQLRVEKPAPQQAAPTPQRAPLSEHDQMAELIKKLQQEKQQLVQQNEHTRIQAYQFVENEKKRLLSDRSWMGNAFQDEAVAVQNELADHVSVFENSVITTLTNRLGNMKVILEGEGYTLADIPGGTGSNKQRMNDLLDIFFDYNRKHVENSGSRKLSKLPQNTASSAYIVDRFKHVGDSVDVVVSVKGAKNGDRIKRRRTTQ